MSVEINRGGFTGDLFDSTDTKIGEVIRGHIVSVVFTGPAAEIATGNVIGPGVFMYITYQL